MSPKCKWPCLLVPAAAGSPPALSLVGFRRPQECWSAEFTSTRCCSSADSPCWLNYPGGFEACCLFKKLPGEDVSLELGATTIGLGKGGYAYRQEGPFQEEFRRSYGLPWPVNEHLVQAVSATWVAAGQNSECLRSCQGEAVVKALDATKALSLQLLEAAGRGLTDVSILARSVLPGFSGTISPGTANFAVDDSLLAAMLVAVDHAKSCETQHRLSAAPGLGDVVAILQRHHTLVSTLVRDTTAPYVHTSFDAHMELNVDLDQLFRTSKQLTKAGVALISKVAFLCNAPSYAESGRIPPVAFEETHCCRFFHLVEGAAAHRFLTLQRQVQVVELGVRFGWLSQYLLSRYEWIRLVGVDLLVDPDRYLFGNVSVALEEVKGRLLPFGSRVRLMMPMSTTRASQLLAKEGLSVDLLVLDARFSREGMLEDLQNYLPLLAPGARVVGRWGLHLIVELHEKGHFAGRKLRNLRIGSVWDGASFSLKVA